MSCLQKINLTIHNYVISFFELQFVISLMSLPLLILWGLPISVMSPLANFIFTPLLIIFLWCSCITTICCLANIPCAILDRAVEGLACLWLHLLSFSRPEWLIGFPSSMLKVSIAVCIFMVLLYTYIKPTAKHCAILLCLIWCSLILIRPYFTHTDGLKKIGPLPLWVACVHNKTYLIDHGALCNRKNRFTNFDYHVLPELIRHTGHTTIDTVIFCKPSNKIAKVAKQCHEQLSCATIMVTPKAQCFQKVQEQFKDENVTIIPLHSAKRKTASSVLNNSK